MMLGEAHRPNPTILVPPWPQLPDDPTADNIFSPHSLNSNANGSPEYSNLYHIPETYAALHRYLPSNDPDLDSDSDMSGLDPDSPVDAYSCDHFRMYEFKVRKCARGRSHDWTECPYAHPGEKARRRDPRKYHYSGTACPDFRKGSCKKGGCKRRVCFFAHTPDQLRILPQQSPRSASASDSPSCAKTLPFLSSPESASPPPSPRTESPMSHSLSRSLGTSSINEMMASFRNLQLGKVKSLPSSWNIQVGGVGGSPGYGSPRGSMLRPGFCSLPSTPTRTPTRPGIGYPDIFNTCWEEEEEEPVMERVESGRDLRAKMFERLSKENSLERVDPYPTNAVDPDLGWITELVNEAK
ncbi:zinc finger CCCH domain-containing protein 20 [Citrus sinensis]|nr:zinc finger CCCH domain-containing protein 20 [Citrus sinensis]